MAGEAAGAEPDRRDRAEPPAPALADLRDTVADGAVEGVIGRGFRPAFIGGAVRVLDPHGAVHGRTVHQGAEAAIVELDDLVDAEEGADRLASAA